MIKIAVIGPESTGKSTLCNELALHYNQKYIPEYAREFLSELKRPYSYEDLAIIAEEQNNLIESGSNNSFNQFLFADTEVLTIKIWSEVKYGRCDSVVSDLFQKQEFDLYLLCSTDIEWQRDPLREVPDLNERKRIFQMFENELKLKSLPYQIVSGKQGERLKNALIFIKEYLNRKD